jgi:hypothetical protein
VISVIGDDLGATIGKSNSVFSLDDSMFILKAISIEISYIKMKVCVCVCVCVCPAACRRTHTSHHPEIWHGFLISPWLGTEPGSDPKCRPPVVPPILTPSEIP